jgi:hypothetical protein
VKAGDPESIAESSLFTPGVSTDGALSERAGLAIVSRGGSSPREGRLEGAVDGEADEVQEMAADRPAERESSALSVELPQLV